MIMGRERTGTFALILSGSGDRKKSSAAEKQSLALKVSVSGKEPS